MSTPLIDREQTSRPTPSDVRQSSYEIPANVRAKSSQLTAPAVSVPARKATRKATEANLNFEMPTMVDKKGRAVTDEKVAARRRWRTRVGNALMAVVVYSAVTFLTTGASTLAARVKLESSRNEGIGGIARSRAALASMDRRNQIGGTANGYLAGAELEQWATTVGFSDAPATRLATVAAPAATKPRDTASSTAPLIPSGPSVRVIRVAAR